MTIIPFKTHICLSFRIQKSIVITYLMVFCQQKSEIPVYFVVLFFFPQVVKAPRSPILPRVVGKFCLPAGNGANKGGRCNNGVRWATANRRGWVLCLGESAEATELFIIWVILMTQGFEFKLQHSDLQEPGGDKIVVFNGQKFKIEWLTVGLMFKLQSGAMQYLYKYHVKSSITHHSAPGYFIHYHCLSTRG